jgi:hypothetical protein
VPSDVLEEAPAGLDLVDEPVNLGPEVAGVVNASPLSSLAEGLAGIPTNDSIHEATPRAAIEGS